MDALPVAIYATDANGYLTYFNPAAEKLVGKTPKLNADRWCIADQLLRSDGAPLQYDQYPTAVVLAGGKLPEGLEVIAVRPDGSRRLVMPLTAALRDSAGNITGAIDLLVDVTDRKAAEVEASEQFRAMVETTPECVNAVASDGKLLFMNRPGLDLIGAATADEVLGQSVYDLIAPEHRDAFRELNERVCRGEKASHQFDIVGLNGVRRHMETHAAPLRHSDGSTVHLAITHDVTERKKAENASLLLSAIVDSSDDAIISKDLNGIITSWNKSAERLFGYTAAEAVGQPVATLLIPADRQEEETKILSLLRRGERVDHFETIRRRKDGQLLDISLTISPIKDPQGVIIGASKIARDISERKRNETAIRTLNGQLTADLAAMARMQRISTRMIQTDDFAQLLEEIIAAGIEITNADMGNIQLLDEDGSLRIVAQQGFQAPFLEFFANVRCGEAACGMAVQRGQRVIVDDVASSPVYAGTAALKVMQEARVMAVQSTPLASRNGKFQGVLSTHYRRPHQPADRDLHLLDILARQAADLIESKRAEAALMASERRFRELADAMPQIVWTAQPDGCVDYYNERWYELTGADRQTFGDASWEPAVHPDDRQKTREVYEDAIRTGQLYNIEYRLWDRQQKRWRWFVGRALPIRDGNGRIKKWFGTCTDIDEQKRVQEEFRRANQDLEQFAFSASHDLQEPLRSIKIYSELLSQRYGSLLDKEGETFLRYLRNGATRMETLVRDLLEYTQVTRADKAVETGDARSALHKALSSLANLIQETSAVITTEALPALPVAEAHLQQLFQNLIGNALKYRSPERPPVVNVAAERQSGRWLFSVKDNGIGINPEYKETIFGIFKRLHTSDEYSGTGIGLAICQRIVDRYHGRIWVESEPGEGSTFRFTLPV